MLTDSIVFATLAISPKYHAMCYKPETSISQQYDELHRFAKDQQAIGRNTLIEEAGIHIRRLQEKMDPCYVEFGSLEESHAHTARIETLKELYEWLDRQFK